MIQVVAWTPDTDKALSYVCPKCMACSLVWDGEWKCRQWGCHYRPAGQTEILTWTPASDRRYCYECPKCRRMKLIWGFEKWQCQDLSCNFSCDSESRSAVVLYPGNREIGPEKNYVMRCPRCDKHSMYWQADEHRCSDSRCQFGTKVVDRSKPVEPVKGEFSACPNCWSAQSLIWDVPSRKWKCLTTGCNFSYSKLMWDKNGHPYDGGELEEKIVPRSDLTHSFSWSGSMPCTGVYSCIYCNKQTNATPFDYSSVSREELCPAKTKENQKMSEWLPPENRWTITDCPVCLHSHCVMWDLNKQKWICSSPSCAFTSNDRPGNAERQQAWTFDKHKNGNTAYCPKCGWLNVVEDARSQAWSCYTVGCGFFKPYPLKPTTESLQIALEAITARVVALEAAEASRKEIVAEKGSQRLCMGCCRTSGVLFDFYKGVTLCQECVNSTAITNALKEAADGADSQPEPQYCKRATELKGWDELTPDQKKTVDIAMRALEVNFDKKDRPAKAKTAPYAYKVAVEQEAEAASERGEWCQQAKDFPGFEGLSLPEKKLVDRAFRFPWGSRTERYSEGFEKEAALQSEAEALEAIEQSRITYRGGKGPIPALGTPNAYENGLKEVCHKCGKEFGPEQKGSNKGNVVVGGHTVVPIGQEGLTCVSCWEKASVVDSDLDPKKRSWNQEQLDELPRYDRDEGPTVGELTAKAEAEAAEVNAKQDDIKASAFLKTAPKALRDALEAKLGAKVALEWISVKVDGEDRWEAYMVSEGVYRVVRSDAPSLTGWTVTLNGDGVKICGKDSLPTVFDALCAAEAAHRDSLLKFTDMSVESRLIRKEAAEDLKNILENTNWSGVKPAPQTSQDPEEAAWVKAAEKTLKNWTKDEYEWRGTEPENNNSEDQVLTIQLKGKLHELLQSWSTRAKSLLDAKKDLVGVVKHTAATDAAMLIDCAKELAQVLGIRVEELKEE